MGRFREVVTAQMPISLYPKGRGQGLWQVAVTKRPDPFQALDLLQFVRR